MHSHMMLSSVRITDHFRFRAFFFDVGLAWTEVATVRVGPSEEVKVRKQYVAIRIISSKSQDKGSIPMDL